MWMIGILLISIWIWLSLIFRAEPHYGWADVVGDSTQLLSIEPRERPPGVFPNLDFGSPPSPEAHDDSLEEDLPPSQWRWSSIWLNKKLHYLFCSILGRSRRNERNSFCNIVDRSFYSFFSFWCSSFCFFFSPFGFPL